MNERYEWKEVRCIMIYAFIILVLCRIPVSAMEVEEAFVSEALGSLLYVVTDDFDEVITFYEDWTNVKWKGTRDPRKMVWNVNEELADSVKSMMARHDVTYCATWVAAYGIFIINKRRYVYRESEWIYSIHGIYNEEE